MQSVSGAGRTSGAAEGIDAHWHTHYTAQGMPMVENGQVSFTVEISLCPTGSNETMGKRGLEIMDSCNKIMG